MFKDKRVSFKIGLFLAFVHFVFFMFIVVPIVRFPDAQWQLTWIVFMFIDFPVSFLCMLVLFFCPEFSFDFLPYPISELRSFILPSIIFGVLGTLWYFYLPVLIANITKNIKERFKKKQQPVKSKRGLKFSLIAFSSLIAVLIVVCFANPMVQEFLPCRLMVTYVDMIFPFTFGGEDDGPGFSPDSKTIICYHTDRSMKKAVITLMTLEGKKIFEFKNLPAEYCREPSFSPDGNRIIFVGHAGDEINLYTMNSDGSNCKVLIKSNRQRNLVYPSYSPDDKSIIFNQGDEIFIMDSDGSNVRLLMKGRRGRFSPDGKSVIFHTGDEGLCIITADGTDKRYIPNTEGCLEASFWSDGKRILCCSKYREEIITMDLQGDNRILLTRKAGDKYEPILSPDGRKIVFTGGYRLKSNIYIMNADGSGLRCLSH